MDESSSNNSSSGTEGQEQPRQEAAAPRLDISSGYEDVDFGAAACAEPKADHEDDADRGEEDEESDGVGDADQDDEEEEEETEMETEKEEEGDATSGEDDKRGETGFMGMEEESGDAAAAAAAEREEQTAQELARKNRLAQTGYDVRALDTVGWTARYQAVMARPKSTARERMVCAVEERRLFDEFAAHAARIAQRLVHEINLPTAEKTIKPINSGGVAGGESLSQDHSLRAETLLSHTHACTQSLSWMESTSSLQGTGAGFMGTTRWRRRRRDTSC